LLWQDRDPIGETIWVENVATRVVGVVGDVREFGLDSRPPQVLYLPESQVADGLGGSIRQWFLSSWIVKSRVPLGRDAVERAVHAVDPAQPVVSLRPMNEVVASWLGPRRFVGRLLDLFAALALLLAAVGVYGVVAYSAGQRRRELGLRAALGARRDELVRLVLGEGLRLAVGGALVGVGLAVALTRFLRGFLFGVGPTNPLVLAAACVGLTAVALVASFLPARRAALADPMEALRHE
jgi:ABC-type lipoprotein release transport system permease subunit